MVIIKAGGARGSEVGRGSPEEEEEDDEEGGAAKGGAKGEDVITARRALPLWSST